MLIKNFKLIPDTTSEVPDTYRCYKSYAEHFEKEYEENLPKIGVKPKFMHQSEMYQSCAYCSEIKATMNGGKITEILNK